jgi:hypothetical protein
MKFKNILTVGFVLLMISCNSKKEFNEIDLNGVLKEIQKSGEFEKTSYELIGDFEEDTNIQKTIKIVLENSKRKDLNREEFSKNAAQKIFDFSKKTKKAKIIWITINQKDALKKDLILNTSLNENLTKNFVYTSEELIK